MSDVVVSTTKSVTSVSTTDNLTEISITETPVEVSSSTAGLQGPPGSNSDPTYVFVRNATGSLLSKGTIVYVSGANGTHTQVTKAIATGDATSARTLGWLAEDIANNASGLCMVEGYLDGVDTQGITEGAQLYLSTTVAGGFQETKPQAPNHLVYVGVAAKASAGNGRVFVKVQNGYELDELHDVQIISKTNKDLLQYDSATNLWKNVASTAITVGSALTSGTAGFATNAGTSVYANSAATAITSGTASYSVLSGTAVTISGSITKSQVSDFTSGTVTSASTAQQAGTAVYSVSAGTSDYSVLSGTAVGLSGSIVRSQVSDFSSGTVASAGTAQQAGTAVFATSAGTSITSGTANYSVLSGTAVTISGTITNSQVSDFASGTVANISGTVTQAQVANLTTDLAGKANLDGGNSFTGAQVIASSGTAIIPLVVRGTAGQSANLLQIETAISTAIRVNQVGNTTFIGNITSQNNATFTPFSTATVPLTVRGASGQSADTLQIQDNSANVLGRINASGQIGVTRLSVTSNAAVQSASRFFAAASTATDVVAVVRGAASQSANLQEWQDSSGGTVAYIAPTGFLNINNASLRINTAGASFNARINVATDGTAVIGQVIRGAPSQSANLQEWQTSTGSTAARISSSGIIATSQAVVSSGDVTSTGGSLKAQNGLVTAGGAVAGGFIQVTRSTAVQANPGANIGTLYFRDGTNANTLKLVVRAGTAGAETTILDNIPT